MANDFERRAALEPLPGNGPIQRYQSKNYLVKEFDPDLVDEESRMLREKVLNTHRRAMDVMPDLITEQHLPDELRANVHRKVWWGLRSDKVEQVTLDHPIIRERNDGRDVASLLKASVEREDSRAAQVLLKGVVGLTHDIIRKGFFPLSIAPQRFAKVRVGETEELRMQDLELLDPDQKHVEQLLRDSGYVNGIRAITMSHYTNVARRAFVDRDFKTFFDNYFTSAVSRIFSYDTTYELGRERRSKSRKDPRVTLARSAS